MQDNDARIIFCRDVDDLASQAAELFVTKAKAAVAARGRFTVALSGCMTAMALNERLGSDALNGQVPWSQVHIFWTDESYSPAGRRKMMEVKHVYAYAGNRYSEADY